MKNVFVSITCVALFATTALTLLPQHPKDPPRPADAAHGRYLVERVGMCQDCHSPRNERGEFVADAWLQGAPLPFTPTIPMPWAAASKPIAGLPGLTDEQAMTFLTKGELPGGRRPLPPMPEFRFAEQDARDVIAYLRSPTPPAAPQPPAGAGR